MSFGQRKGKVAIKIVEKVQANWIKVKQSEKKKTKMLRHL